MRTRLSQALGCALMALALIAAAARPASAAPIPISPAPALLPGYQVEWVQVAESPHSIADAYNALAGIGFTVLDTFTEYRDFIDLDDSHVPFAGADPVFAVRVTGYVTLPADDTYTFLSYHDDGIRVVVGGEEVILFPTDTAPVFTDSAPYALSAGVYKYEAVSWEQGGVFNLDLGIDSIATGRRFLGGAHAVPEPASLSLLGVGLAGLVAARRRRRAKR